MGPAHRAGEFYFPPQLPACSTPCLFGSIQPLKCEHCFHSSRSCFYFRRTPRRPSPSARAAAESFPSLHCLPSASGARARSPVPKPRLAPPPRSTPPCRRTVPPPSPTRCSTDSEPCRPDRTRSPPGAAVVRPRSGPAPPPIAPRSSWPPCRITPARIRPWPAFPTRSARAAPRRWSKLPRTKFFTASPARPGRG